jgi:hypothetical protein
MAKDKWFNNKIDAKALYPVIEELFSQFGPPYGAADNKIVPNGFFWSALAINTLLRSREYAANPIQDDCSNKKDEVTTYSYIHNETAMLTLGLTVLSWLKVNLKKKTENGHCNNPNHAPTETKPANCSIGSRFHKELYNDFANIIEEFLATVKNCKPTPINLPTET